ncbi:putative N-acetylglucosamine-6-phosphate deacetylase-like protein [Phlyctochytrium arcticum]|nr:putative N-acetylglucosamine-6-phosphate deacetylase-like protein [Phlyctochytrium arcticum]
MPITKLQSIALPPNHSSPCTRLINGRVLHGNALLATDVWMQNGLIIDPPNDLNWSDPSTVTTIDVNGKMIAPGLIDIQINGAFGVDFSDPGAYQEHGGHVARQLLRYGCTAFCPTVISSPTSTYHQVLPTIFPRAGSAATGATVLGAHLEGPFISERKKGAHEHVRVADSEAYWDVEETYGGSLAEGKVAVVTLAPELVGGQAAIRQLLAKDVVVAMGHSDATYAEAMQYVHDGATLVTHLFNAMREFHHREPGPIGLLMDETCPRFFYSIISDGIHVHPLCLRMAHRLRPSSAILVTDANAAMGLPDGMYKLGPFEARKVGWTVYKGDTDVLAGSALPIDQCIANYARFAGCSIAHALACATLHPAQLLGIDQIKGTLAVGAHADVIVLDEKDLRVVRVFVAGQEVDLRQDIDVRVATETSSCSV